MRHSVICHLPNLTPSNIHALLSGWLEWVHCMWNACTYKVNQHHMISTEGTDSLATTFHPHQPAIHVVGVITWASRVITSASSVPLSEPAVWPTDSYQKGNMRPYINCTLSPIYHFLKQNGFQWTPTNVCDSIKIQIVHCSCNREGIGSATGTKVADSPPGPLLISELDYLLLQEKSVSMYATYLLKNLLWAEILQLYGTALAVEVFASWGSGGKRHWHFLVLLQSLILTLNSNMMVLARIFKV